MKIPGFFNKHMVIKVYDGFFSRYGITHHPLTGKTLQLLPLNAIISMEYGSIFGRTQFYLRDLRILLNTKAPVLYYYTIKS